MSSAGEILLSGTIIYGDDQQVLKRYISICDGIIREVGEGQVDSHLQGIICPRFVNAHTHIADSAFKDPPFLSLSDLVGPGGWKHRKLLQTPRQRLEEGMRRSLRTMMATGTCAFADFREGGPDGVEMLCEVLRDYPLISRIMGRPRDGEACIHEGCWGLGISSTRDHDSEWLRAAVQAARSKGHAVAVHAGEAGRDDISDALDLEPDFLVHMNRASEDDLKRAACAGVPIVICPRSNLVTGVGMPDVKKMIDLGITVGVGTDNVMLNSPNIFDEMQLIGKALLHDDRQVFNMCTLNGAKIMGIDQRVGSICEGKEGRVMVIDGRSDNLGGSENPLASLVRRASPSDVLAIF